MVGQTISHYKVIEKIGQVRIEKLEHIDGNQWNG